MDDEIGDGRGVANGLDKGHVDVVVDVDHRSASSMLDAQDNTINNKCCCYCRNKHT